MARAVKKIGMQTQPEIASGAFHRDASMQASWEATESISCECESFGRIDDFKNCCSVYDEAVMEGFEVNYPGISAGPPQPTVPFFAPLSSVNPFKSAQANVTVDWTVQDFRGYVQDLATPFIDLRSALQKTLRGQSASFGPFIMSALTGGEIPNIPRTDVPATGVDIAEILNYIEVFWEIGKDGISTALYGPTKYKCYFQQGSYEAATGGPTWDEDGNQTIFKVCENDAHWSDVAAIAGADESAAVGFDRLLTVTWPSWSDWGQFFEGVAKDVVDLAANLQWGVGGDYTGDPFSNNWHGGLLPQFGISTDINFNDLSGLDPMADPQGFRVAFNSALQSIPLGLEELYESYNWEGDVYREVIDAVSNPGWLEGVLNVSTLGLLSDEISLIFSPLEGLDVQLEDTYKLIRKLVEKWIPQLDPLVTEVVNIPSSILGWTPPAMIPTAMSAQAALQIRSHQVAAMSPPPPLVRVDKVSLPPFADGVFDDLLECEPSPVDAVPPQYWLDGALKDVTQHGFSLSDLGYTPSDWWEDQTDIIGSLGAFIQNISSVVDKVLDLEDLIEEMMDDIGYELKSKLSWLERTIQRLNRHLKLIPDTIQAQDLYTFPWPGMDDDNNLEWDSYTVSFQPPDWLTDLLDGYHDGWEAVISGLNEAVIVTRMAISHIEKIQKLLPGLYSQLNIWWNGDESFVGSTQLVQPFSYRSSVPSTPYSGWGLPSRGRTSGRKRTKQRVTIGKSAARGGGSAQAAVSYSPVSSEVSADFDAQAVLSAAVRGNARDIVEDVYSYLMELEIPAPLMLNTLDLHWFWDSGWANPQLWYTACCAASRCSKGWGADQTAYFDSLTAQSIVDYLAEKGEQNQQEQGEQFPDDEDGDPFDPKSQTLNGITAAYGSAMVFQENLLWKYKWWILGGALAIGWYQKGKK